MRRIPLLCALLVGMGLVNLVEVSSAPAAGIRSAAPSVRLAAFHFGRHRGFGGGFGLFGRRRRSHHLLRRIAHAVAIAYLLHLLFTHGALSLLIWVLAIALVVSLVRRRRRRLRP